jgi:hypothetical protein
MDYGSVSCRVQTQYGPLRAYKFKDVDTGIGYLALVQGQVGGLGPVLWTASRMKHLFSEGEELRYYIRRWTCDLSG